MSFYKVKFDPKAKKEFDNLDGRLKIEAAKKIKKISEKPDLGKILGNKYGFNLNNCRSIRFDNGNQRIVYQVNEKIIMVYIISIAKREDANVYKNAFSRL